MSEEIKGLSEKEVLRRRQQGDGEKPPENITKSTGQIVRENTLTLFNVLNFMIAVLLFSVGAYSNMLFIGIIILNIVIGIAQELKAKKLVDELSVLSRPKVMVRRDGADLEIAREEIVRGDILVLSGGKQIASDCELLSGDIEVNESLLTGESDAIAKEKGGLCYSGSFVISGKGYARVVHVGDENYAVSLTNEVKREKRVASELLGSMRRVTSFTSWLIVPMGMLLFIEAYFMRHAQMYDAVVSSSAALLGMLPKGLVLLISVSLAAGVIRLARMKILVQNIYSLETLAHVDTLCLDKTGTITDGRLRVVKRMALSEQTKQCMELVESYMVACTDSNATYEALSEVFPAEAVYEPSHIIPFSSKRKYSAVSFGSMGTIFVGAPDKFVRVMPPELSHELEAGHRLVVIAYSPEDWRKGDCLPGDTRLLYAVSLEDNIRENTAETLEFFRQQGVDVKVISGDHVSTVSVIAKRAGLADWKSAVDMSAVGDDADYDRLCREYSVFARVTPRQKQELVIAMKKQGHKVAMTGDGVNDLLALREADCSIAVADGSDASRQLAQVVLLDSDFTNLPDVVMEGRRVVNNVTRTAGVFFIKTIYSVLVTVFCLLTNTAFPFIPIQITLVDACIEAYPSFLSIVEADTRPIRGTFLKTALSRALPFALAVTAVIVGVSLLAPFDAFQKQTVMYMALILVSMAAVIRSCIPFSALRVFISTTMAGGTFFALWLLPKLFSVSAITGSMLMWICGAVCAAACVIAICMGIQYAASHGGITNNMSDRGRRTAADGSRWTRAVRKHGVRE